MEMNEKVAYIKGLMEGMELDTSKKEGKILNAILDVLSDVTDKVMTMDEEVGDLFDEVDAISDDLTDVEDFLWEDDDEDDEDEDADDEYEDGLYEITCPACGEVVCVDEDMLADDNLSCPNCGTKFEVDFTEDDDCCCGGDCDGGCDKK
ncbi:MAG: hypothetical protein RSD01_07015 [Ruthenibacterium sp.]